MSKTSLKTGLLTKGAIAVAVAVFLLAAVPANAASGGATGNYLFTFYDIGTAVGDNPITPTPCIGTPGGDNVIRLIDPNGCGNGGVGNAACRSETDLCAMFYVFDDDQEMGECCGCPITPNGLNTYSVREELVSNWALATQDNSLGTIVVVGSGINDPGISSIPGATASNLTESIEVSNGCGNVYNPSCNGGCDPTKPAITTGATNLDGSITHDQLVAGMNNLTATPLFDQGAGEPTNNAYLVAQCASLVSSNSLQAGFCYCEEAEIR